MKMIYILVEKYSDSGIDYLEYDEKQLFAFLTQESAEKMLTAYKARKMRNYSYEIIELPLVDAT